MDTRISNSDLSDYLKVQKVRTLSFPFAGWAGLNLQTSLSRGVIGKYFRKGVPLGSPSPSAVISVHISGSCSVAAAGGIGDISGSVVIAIDQGEDPFSVVVGPRLKQDSAADIFLHQSVLSTDAASDANSPFFLQRTFTDGFIPIVNGDQLVQAYTNNLTVGSTAVRIVGLATFTYVIIS